MHHHAYQARNEANANAPYYIESFYNRPRLHSAPDYLSPEEYEQLYYQQQEVISA